MKRPSSHNGVKSRPDKTRNDDHGMNGNGNGAVKEMTMEYEQEGGEGEWEEKVPDGIPGIWTYQDDRVLQGTDAKLLEALERKHGGEAFEARWHFLMSWNEP